MEKKFRVWDKKENKMIYPEKFSDKIVIQLGGVIGLFNGSTYDTETDRFILLQFTGLLDKNGKEIYEGDILKTQGHKDNYPTKHIAIFNEEELGFKLRWYQHYTDKKYKGFYDIKISDNPYKVFEIIGNIYSNPELLK